MLSPISQELQNLIGVIAGDESAAAGDDFVNVLLGLDSCGCPGLYPEGCHAVKLFLRCHVDRAVERTEHAAAVCGGSIGIALNLAHVGEGIVDVAAILCAVLIFHILVELAVEGVDDNAIGKAVVVDDLKNAVANVVCDLVAAVDGIFLELNVEGHCGMILHKLHKFNKRGDLLAREFSALPGAGIEGFELCESLVADLARAVCGAVNGCIVDADELAVAGDADVGFDLVNADLDRLFECENGVLGVNRVPSAVRGDIYVVLAECPVIPPKEFFIIISPFRFKVNIFPYDI